MKNLILLVFGVVITLVLVLFSSHIYEALYYERAFSDAMYNGNVYFMIALFSSIILWVMAIVYYYIINSVRFSRWYHWLIALVSVAVLTPIINYTYPSNIFSGDGLDFGGQLFSFCIVDLAIEIVLFVIASFSLRWWSANCRHTPIPE